MSLVVIYSADIVSATSFDLLPFIAYYYANVMLRPSLLTLKGFSVFPYGAHFIYAFSELELFLHIQVKAKQTKKLCNPVCVTFNVDQSDWVFFFCQASQCHHTVASWAAKDYQKWSEGTFCSVESLLGCFVSL